MRGLKAILLACAVGFSTLSAQGLNPFYGDDSDQDPDHDGLSNIMEYIYSTDPYDTDTDNGGIDDGWEAYFDRNRASFGPNSPYACFDSDGDGLCDVNVDPDYKFDPADESDERDYPDSDGWNNFREYCEGTDPTNPDTDGDGLVDDKDPQGLVPGRGESGDYFGCGTPPAGSQPEEGRTARGEGLATAFAMSWECSLDLSIVVKQQPDEWMSGDKARVMR